MWVRAFEPDRGHTAKYFKFAQRYLSFHHEDCIEVCGDHHEEIHTIYWNKIDLWIMQSQKLYKPFEHWSWRDAESLMKHLRKVCDEWATKPTPGIKSRRYTTFP